jgi:hypothetical protein
MIIHHFNTYFDTSNTNLSTWIEHIAKMTQEIKNNDVDKEIQITMCIKILNFIAYLLLSVTNIYYDSLSINLKHHVEVMDVKFTDIYEEMELYPVEVYVCFHTLYFYLFYFFRYQTISMNSIHPC